MKTKIIDVGNDLNLLKKTLRELRLERKISLRSLSESMGIPISTFCGFEDVKKGLKTINKNYVDYLAGFYGVEIKCSRDILSYSIPNKKNSFFDERRKRYKKLTEELKRIREKKKMSLETVSSESKGEISFWTLKGVEKNDFRVNDNVIFLLAKIYDVDPDYFFNILYGNKLLEREKNKLEEFRKIRKIPDRDRFGISKRLFDLRVEKKLTQKEVSEATGIPFNYIRDTEKGKYNPNDERLKIIANFYNVSFQELKDIRDTFKEEKKSNWVKVKPKIKEEEVKELPFAKDIKSFGEVLRYLRTLNNLSMYDVRKLSKKTLHVVTVSKSELNRSFPTDDTIKMLAHIYKVDYASLRVTLLNRKVRLQKRSNREDYKKDLVLLDALLEAGVQRWSGYGKALEIYSEKIEGLEAGTYVVKKQNI